MFSKLFKKKSNIKADEPVQRLPDRFSFMPDEEQQHFQDDITKFFQSKNPTFVINFSEGFIKGSDRMQYGLDNLAQKYYYATKYAKMGDKDKAEIIADHFNGIFEGKKREKEILENIEDFDNVKQYLAIRLYSFDYAKQVKEKGIIYQEDIEGVLTVLVFDLPTTVVNVKPEQAAVWKKEKDELFTIGFNNTFANNKVEINQNKIDDTVPLWSIGADNVFATTYIYNLSEYPQLIGTFGSVVSIPHRHSLLILPIQDKSVIAGLKHFMLITKGMFKEGPGSISSNIYWYHDQKLMNLPYKIDEKGVNFFPPDEFLEVLNKVAAINVDDHLVKLQGMFEKMKNETKWDVSKPMLWGYFFIDSDKKKLKELSESLSKKKFSVVNISKTDDKKSYRLQIEEKFIHTPESLLEQIHNFEKLAKKHDVSAFDGWDVGLIGN